MTDFTYTKNFGTDSSFVDGVFYNENEKYAVVELADDYYLYENVSESDVADLVNAPSVGAHYNTVFKKAHGPGEHLGSWSGVDFEWVPAAHGTGTTPKDLTEPTKEFSLQAFANHHGLEVNGTTEAVASTKEYSLAEIPVTDVAGPEKIEAGTGVTSTVFFTIEGIDDKVFEFESDKDDIDPAVGEVHEYVKRLGVVGRVVKVVFEFE